MRECVFILCLVEDLEELADEVDTSNIIPRARRRAAAAAMSAPMRLPEKKSTHSDSDSDEVEF